MYFLGATTGSGKNYTAEQVTADLIAGGWDESGCFNKCPGRRTLVFVVRVRTTETTTLQA